MDRTRRFAAGWLVAAVLGVSALNGCTLFGGGDDIADDKPPQIEVGGNGRVKDSIATYTAESGSYKVTMDVIALKRYDDVVRLVFAVTPQSKGGSDPLPSDAFSSETLGNDVTGVYLLDTDNMRKYPVLSGGKECVCSNELDDFPLDQPTALYADYPAPPDSVESMTVVFKNVGPLPGVEVSA
ncbi:MAG: hypothetical protein GEV07_20285 [Streptosporangiales bacterium]|nr:hypothetical protein [Streptosporangiales bacterium]